MPNTVTVTNSYVYDHAGFRSVRYGAQFPSRQDKIISIVALSKSELVAHLVDFPKDFVSERKRICFQMSFCI